jgi:hypothetical protein
MKWLEADSLPGQHVLQQLFLLGDDAVNY